MTAKDFIIDNGGDWKTVETICKCFPDFNREATLAFIIKAVNAIDRSALMITAQEEEIFGIFYLKISCSSKPYQKLSDVFNQMRDFTPTLLGAFDQ